MLIWQIPWNALIHKYHFRPIRPQKIEIINDWLFCKRGHFEFQGLYRPHAQLQLKQTQKQWKKEGVVIGTWYIYEVSIEAKEREGVGGWIIA